MAAALPASFYDRPVVEVAQALVGCIVRHGSETGRIVETEAYHDSEPACHAFVGLTPRTATLFDRPGIAYVYRSYGVHALLNAVCEDESTGAAVLIRALEPLSGVEAMRRRRGRRRVEDLCSGPGKLTQALGFGVEHNGTSLRSGPVRIEPAPGPALAVTAGPRIGITRATELPWRFCATSSTCVSRPWPAAMRRRVSRSAG